MIAFKIVTLYSSAKSRVHNGSLAHDFATLEDAKKLADFVFDNDERYYLIVSVIVPQVILGGSK